jgi:hypothetical protein
MNDKTHNGWANYETWAWNLWLDNEQGSQEAAMQMAREAIADAEPNAVFTKEQAAQYALADRMKDEAEEAMPEVEGVWADLLRGALSEVNWSEIAKYWIETLTNG